MKIIFAQGNPEPNYEKTRHNVGFTILNTIAEDHGAKWNKKAKFQADIAEIKINSQKVILVKPSTFYNETGTSARSIIDFYKITPEKDFCVIHDDFALPFGTIRIRGQGSDAGNNGIKSINAHINQLYTRIRIGIWTELREQIEDSEFVISKFKAEENKQLRKNIIPKAIEYIEQFCKDENIITSNKIDLN